MTDWEAIGNACRSRYKAQIADVYTILTQYDNDNFDEPDETTPLTMGMWIRFTVIFNDSEHKEMGETRSDRTEGLCIAQIFSQIQQGDKNSLIMAGYIRDTFRGVTASGVRFKIPRVQRIGRMQKWYQVNVSCPWDADDTF